MKEVRVMNLKYKVDEISAVEQNEFVRNAANADFMQLTYWKKYKAPVWYSRTVSFYDDDKLIGLCQLLFKKVPKMKATLCYTARGPIFDLSNAEYCKFIMHSIKEVAKKERAFLIKMDSYARRKETTDALIREMSECGFTHKGFALELGSTYQPRFSMMKDIDVPSDEIIDTMPKDIKRNIKKALSNKVKYEFADLNGLGIFYGMMRETEKRQGIDNGRSLDDYKKILESFELNKNIFLPLTFVVAGELKEVFIKQREDTEKELKNINKKINKAGEGMAQDKLENYKKEVGILQGRLEKYNREIEAIDSEYDKDEKIYLAGGVLICDGHRSVYLYGASTDKYRELYPAYLLQLIMMQKARDCGFKTYDFGGISGYIDEETCPDSEPYGLFTFKKQFDSYVYESVGEFYCVMNKKVYGLYKLFDKMRRLKRGLRG